MCIYLYIQHLSLKTHILALPPCVCCQESGDNSAGADEKTSKKAPKRSLAATIERMEKHKILERKRREKTKELVSELQVFTCMYVLVESD